MLFLGVFLVTPLAIVAFQMSLSQVPRSAPGMKLEIPLHSLSSILLLSAALKV